MEKILSTTIEMGKLCKLEIREKTTVPFAMGKERIKEEILVEKKSNV